MSVTGIEAQIAAAEAEAAALEQIMGGGEAVQRLLTAKDKVQRLRALVPLAAPVLTRNDLGRMSAQEIAQLPEDEINRVLGGGDR